MELIKINSRFGFYIRDNGHVGSVEKDFEIIDGKLVHKENGSTFSEGILYRNPHTDESSNHPRHPVGILKDIHLARRLLSQDDYEGLHTVMVGDSGDERSYLITDPQTPLFVVRQEFRSRYSEEWKAVDVAVDSLFGDGSVMPWKMYDSMFREASSTSNDNIKTITLNETPFSLKRGENNTRSISWNYDPKK